MRNSSLVKCFRAENDRGSSLVPKSRISTPSGAVGVVEEHSQGVESEPTRICGALGRDYAGMSSDNTSVKLVRRKPKVSRGRLIRPGLVGPKSRPDRRR